MASAAADVDVIVIRARTNAAARRISAIEVTFDQVAFWPEASVRCLAAIRPESGVKPTCRDSWTDAFDPTATSNLLKIGDRLSAISHLPPVAK
jgi:hypothetical protein